MNPQCFLPFQSGHDRINSSVSFMHYQEIPVRPQ